MGSKVIPLLIFSGALLLFIVVIGHPILPNSWDGETAMHEMRHCSIWIWDHSLTLIALTAWLSGLSELETKINPNAHSAGRLFTTALSLWSIVLIAEISAVPYLMSSLEKHPNIAVETVTKSLFCLSLMTGYIANLFIWFGIFLLGFLIKKEKASPAWLADFAVISAILGLIATLYTLFFPKYDPIIPLAIGSTLPFLWTIVFSCYLLFHSIKID